MSKLFKDTQKKRKPVRGGLFLGWTAKKKKITIFLKILRAISSEWCRQVMDLVLRYKVNTFLSIVYNWAIPRQTSPDVV